VHLLLGNYFYLGGYSCYMCWSLAWWQIHESQFPIVDLLARQILWISRSQIETKQVFNLIGVLIPWRHCKLHVENLNNITTMVKNWPNDPCMNCSWHKDLTLWKLKFHWLKKIMM
jgi:hypothetical protein